MSHVLLLSIGIVIFCVIGLPFGISGHPSHCGRKR